MQWVAPSYIPPDNQPFTPATPTKSTQCLLMRSSADFILKKLKIENPIRYLEELGEIT